MKDFYYILGVERNASLDAIKKAYKMLALKFHPDINKGDKFFEERFKDIQEAYETLSNTETRKRYDYAWKVFTSGTSYDKTREEELKKQREAFEKQKNEQRETDRKREEELRKQKEVFEKQKGDFEKQKNEKNETEKKYSPPSPPKSAPKSSVDISDKSIFYISLGIIALLAIGFIISINNNSSNSTSIVNSIPLESVSTRTVTNTETLGSTNQSINASATPSCDLNWIFFDYDKSEIRSNAVASLDHLVTLMKENTASTTLFKAFTDAKGTSDYNEALSLRRATAAKDYLISQGIDRDRIKMDHLGKSEPVANNTTDDSGRHYNRRVEIYLKDKDGKNICQSVEPTVPSNLRK